MVRFHILSIFLKSNQSSTFHKQENVHKTQLNIMNMRFTKIWVYVALLYNSNTLVISLYWTKI